MLHSDCGDCPKKEPECDCNKPLCEQPEECADKCGTDKPTCKWSEWSNFCPCSASCDEGVTTQKRKCYCGEGDNWEEATVLPQPGCEGDSVNDQPCNDGPCDPTEGCEKDPARQCTPGKHIYPSAFSDHKLNY